MIGVLLASLAAVGMQATAITQGCRVVAGTNWAFVSTPPTGWSVACGKNALDDTVITLWPTVQGSRKAKALIYVAVAPRGKNSFSQVIKNEITQYESEYQSKSTYVSPVVTVSTTRRLVHYTNSHGGRDELVEYVQGAKVYFTIVLTTVSPAATKRYKEAFQEFAFSFSPATVKRGG